MNGIDLHNKLRQGQVAMAEVWKTHSWPQRHFAEMLGFVEVNVYKTLSYFVKGNWKAMSHTEFRRRLAWSLLTLGKEPYYNDSYAKEMSSCNSSNSEQPASSMPGSAHGLYCGPQQHFYCTFTDGKRHTCGYCGSETTKFCSECAHIGLGIIAVCGRRSKRGSECIEAHQAGAKIKHSSWKRKRKAAPAGEPSPES